MNSVADHTFLSHAAAMVKGAREDLAEDNARAAAEQTKRDWKEFERLVRQFGFCNCLAVMSGVAEDLQSEFPEGSHQEKDYMQAQEVLEIASAGCDLTYASGTGGAQLARSRALVNMRKLIGATHE